MPIPAPHVNRYIYHFSHIDNLPGLLQTGFLANNHADFPITGHRSVAERGIQERRANMVVTCGPGGVVHDYVPLYFGSLSPMLLGVINKKNVDQMEMLYFEFPIALLDSEEVVFTDASANTNPPPNFYSNPENLTNLNWTEIDSLRWSSANDGLRHQRMAEVLIHNHLPLMAAQRVVVWSDRERIRVQEYVAAAGVPFPPIEFESRYRRHWFNNFMEGSRTSVVMGPREIANNYRYYCEQITGNAGNNEAQFETPVELLESLNQNFACLPHTAELVGLTSENFIHTLTVEAHTIAVVERLRSFEEYEEFAPAEKQWIELVAYLHDIGKGPQARWTRNGGVQKTDPDHPIRALPMLVDIFTQFVRRFDHEVALLIFKLVCYHDLIGDVLGKGRDENQIINVVDNEQELKMLFALGKADATSLVEWWWDENQAERLYARCLAAIQARGDL